jgi:hypothetical protein
VAADTRRWQSVVGAGGSRAKIRLRYGRQSGHRRGPAELRPKDRSGVTVSADRVPAAVARGHQAPDPQPHAHQAFMFVPGQGSHASDDAAAAFPATVTARPDSESPTRRHGTQADTRGDRRTTRSGWGLALLLAHRVPLLANGRPASWARQNKAMSRRTLYRSNTELLSLSWGYAAW